MDKLIILGHRRIAPMPLGGNSRRRPLDDLSPTRPIPVGTTHDFALALTRHGSNSWVGTAEWLRHGFAS
jgi:hypothetical protein